MNKTELLDIVAKKTLVSKAKCDAVLKEIKNTIVEVLRKGEEVSLKDFGKFKVVETKERKCINPVTKRFYIVKPKKVTTFKSYKNFKLCVK